MIQYLQGTLVEIQKLTKSRAILVLEVNQIGYEIQIVPRLLSALPALGEPVLIRVETGIRTAS